MAQFPQLEVISSFGVGYDHIDAKAAARRGNRRRAYAGRARRRDRRHRDRGWCSTRCAASPPPSAICARDDGRRRAPFPLTASLRGRKMGVLGLGRIGKEIAKRAAAFGVEVVYHGRKAAARRALSLLSLADRDGEGGRYPDGRRPGGADTRHIVNAEVLAALGENGVLDQHRARLAGGRRRAGRGAAQAQNPGRRPRRIRRRSRRCRRAISTLDNVVLTPHVGSATTRDAAGDGQPHGRQPVRLHGRQRPDRARRRKRRGR